jgi:hypothetical protein
MLPLSSSIINALGKLSSMILTKINSAKDSAGNTVQNETSTSADNITFEFSSPDADVSKFQCSIDGAALEDNCTSPKSYSNLAAGQQHTFRVNAVDAAGNADPTPAVYVWTVEAQDTTAPETVIDSAKDGDGNAVSDGDTVHSDTIAFTFSSPDADVSKFQCSIDGAALENNCTSPKSYSGLSDGAHTFSVTAVDGAGNLDQTPATFEWTVTTSGQGSSTYVIEGFYPPIDPAPTFTVVSSGRTLPFKFNVYEEVSSSDGSTRTEIKDTSIVKSFEVVRDVSRAECNNADVDAAEETSTDSTSLVYDTQEGHFIQYWKLTPKTTYPSKSCWTATLTVGDDVATATKEALIKIR